MSTRIQQNAKPFSGAMVLMWTGIKLQTGMHWMSEFVIFPRYNEYLLWTADSCSSLSFQFTEHIARPLTSWDRLFSCDFHSHSVQPFRSLVLSLSPLFSYVFTATEFHAPFAIRIQSINFPPYPCSAVHASVKMHIAFVRRREFSVTIRTDLQLKPTTSDSKSVNH